MPQRKYELHGGKMGAAIAVRVVPRASKNQISEILSDGTIKIRLTAPPVDGKANEGLLKFLAEILDISATKIEIVAGITSRDKLVSILDLDPDTVYQKIVIHLKD